MGKTMLNRRQKQLLVIIGVVAALLLAVAVGLLAILLRKPGSTGPAGGASGQVATMGLGEALGSKLQGEQAQKLNGYANVADFGAVPGDGKDDTAAFEAAAKTGYSLFVPAGEYRLERPIALNGQGLTGCGAQATRIVSAARDAAAPIFYLGGCVTVSDLAIGYDPALLTGSEKEGERVALQAGAAVPLRYGSTVRSVCFENVGTAILVDPAKNGGGNGAVFEQIMVRNFTFRGIDLRTDGSGCNALRSISVRDSGDGADCAVYLGGGQADVLDQLIARNCRLKNGVTVAPKAEAVVRGLSFEQCTLSGKELA